MQLVDLETAILEVTQTCRSCGTIISQSVVEYVRLLEILKEVKPHCLGPLIFQSHYVIVNTVYLHHSIVKKLTHHSEDLEDVHNELCSCRISKSNSDAIFYKVTTLPMMCSFCGGWCYYRLYDRPIRRFIDLYLHETAIKNLLAYGKNHTKSK